MEFERLQNSFALTAGDTLLPGASDYSVGAIAIVLPSEKLALEFIEAQCEDMEAPGIGQTGVVAVGDPWKFMRRTAGEGLAGIQCADPKSPDTFMFMVRVEEAGSDLPTILATSDHNGMGPCLTRSGVKPLSHAEVLHWERYDILDRVSSRWGATCPFRHWDHGDPLYELTAKEIVPILAHVPLMGDWNNPDGAFVFFTSEEAALDYKAHKLGDGRNRILTTGNSNFGSVAEAMAGLRPTRVDELSGRLKELEKIAGIIAAWCINPTGHREDSGFGRLCETEENQSHRMRTVSGNWKVSTGNHFKKIKEPLVWSGRDTICWSGGQSIQLLPLDVSYGSDPIRDAESASPMSEVEAEEWVVDFLSQSSVEEMLRQEKEAPSLDSFFVNCWDSVTGDHYEPIPEFSGFLSALQFLAAYERERDAQFRLKGAASCNAIGFVGSGDERHEKLRGQRFHRGLLNLAKRHLLDGYHPSYAGDLVAVANATMKTLHVDFAGYAKDLLWATESGSVDTLLDELGIQSDVWRTWSESAEPTIDSRGKELGIERIGESVWNLLDPKVRHFLSTALRHLEQQGHAPQLDYAPISLEVVKALEVELVNIFRDFRKTSVGTKLAAGKEHHERQLNKFVYDGGKPPLLGQISYLLRNTGENVSELKSALDQHLISLPNGAFLSSDEFAEKALDRVRNVYRNEGAHSSPISENICRDCVDDLIGTTEKPGLIPQVTKWRGRN